MPKPKLAVAARPYEERVQSIPGDVIDNFDYAVDALQAFQWMLSAQGEDFHCQPNQMFQLIHPHINALLEYRDAMDAAAKAGGAE